MARTFTFKSNTTNDCLRVYIVKLVRTKRINVCKMHFIRTVQYK